MKKLWELILTLVVISLFASHPSGASILTTEWGPDALEGVKLIQNAHLIIGKESTRLTPVAAGVREKKIILLWVKVYVVQLLSGEPEKFDRSSTQAEMKSIEQTRTVVLSLNYLRPLEISKIKSSFEDSLHANDVDTRAPIFRRIFDAIEKSGGAKKNSKFVIAIQHGKNGESALTFENPIGEIQSIQVPTPVARQFLGIWLGSPSDGGIEKLQKEFLKPVPGVTPPPTASHPSTASAATH